MKKAILIALVLVIVVMGTLLMVGCSSVPAQRSLVSRWSNDKTEIAEYTAVRKLSDTESVSGKMTMTTKRYTNDTITVGGETISGFTGTLVTTDALMDDSSTMQTAVAFNTKFVPVISYKETFVKGYEGQDIKVDTTTTLLGKYIGTSYQYTLKTSKLDTEGTSTPGNIKLESWDTKPYIDNLMLYHIARSCFSGKDGAFTQFSFVSPAYDNNKLKNIDINMISDSSTMDALEPRQTFSSYTIAISLVQDFPAPGTPNYVHISRYPINEVDHVMLEISEREFTYTLASISEE